MSARSSAARTAARRQRGRIEVKSDDFEGRTAQHPLYRMIYILAKAHGAVDWFNGNTAAGQKIVGDAVKEKPEDVAADLTTLQLFDLSKSKEVMGTPASHGKIYDNVKAAAQFWKDQGKVPQVVDPNKAVDSSFINSL